MPALPAASWAVRVGGLVAIALGLLIWVAPDLNAGIRPVHMLAGLTVAVGLLVLSLLAMRGGSPGLPLVGLAWVVLLPAFGLSQETLLVGDLHFLVRVAHLLVGVVAIGLGEALALRITRTQRRLRNAR